MAALQVAAGNKFFLARSFPTCIARGCYDMQHMCIASKLLILLKRVSH